MQEDYKEKFKDMLRETGVPEGLIPPDGLIPPKSLIPPGSLFPNNKK